MTGLVLVSKNRLNISRSCEFSNADRFSENAIETETPEMRPFRSVRLVLDTDLVWDSGLRVIFT
ncbi:hypothetical protein TcasGA2_TC007355 [Tribolium castaneum]|uniref:Uncharacterized protein n=1 Tax=Tribolium castaneum TaxID=7070 RepID=D2A026_TRICA|nr:hypothetical protein TcasGA2_TC007355 [Tribolium castaneum]